MARLSIQDTLMDIKNKISAKSDNFEGKVSIDQNCYKLLEDMLVYCAKEKKNFGAYIGAIDNLQIYADKLYSLYNFGCNCDMGAFINLLDDYLKEKITKKEIELCLN